MNFCFFFLLSLLLQRSRSHISVDNVGLFTTPRKLIHSLQDLNDANSDFSEKQSRGIRTPASIKFERNPTPRRNGYSREIFYDMKGNGDLCNGVEQFQGTSESVSSTDDSPVTPVSISPVTPSSVDMDQPTQELVLKCKPEVPMSSVKRTSRKTALIFAFGLVFMLLAVLVTTVFVDQDAGHHLVPT